MRAAVYLDPPTHHLRGNRIFEPEGNPYAGDDILAPYVAVRDRLVEAGFPVRTADLIPDRPDGRRHFVVSFGAADRLVSHTMRRYRALSRRDDVVLSAFFAMECPVVEPRMFKALPGLEGLFRRIFSWSDSEALLPFTRSPVRTRHFAWPQSFDDVDERLWRREPRRFLLMMNANKLPRLYHRELYTERLRAVEYFHRHGEIDLYGRNWDRAPTRVGKTATPFALRRVASAAWEARQRVWPDALYTAAAGASRGPTPSKSETVSRYRFALCFENSELKGWITEKIFDCFHVGTIPIYRGAPDILDWVPAECFIDMRRFCDFDDLRAYLHAMPPAEERRLRSCARDYVASARFDPFRRAAFADIVASVVMADAGDQA